MSPEEIEEIYKELDLEEEGLTEDDIIRRKRRIFVGGLKFASEDQVLFDHFTKFGEIKEAVVIRDRKTGMSKGYGFVTMCEDKHALLAIADKAPKLDGRRCNVNLAYIGEKRKPRTKKPDMRIMDIPTHHVYSLNGYGMAPQVVTANGQIYQLGLPPLHGHTPVYHFPSPAPSPSFEPIENLPGYSPLSPLPQQPIFFSQPFVINNHVTPINNNNIHSVPSALYQQNGEQQHIEQINGQINNNLAFYPSKSTPSQANISQTPDIIPVTTTNFTSNTSNNKEIVADGLPIIISDHQNALHVINGTHVVVNNKQSHLNIVSTNANNNNNNSIVINNNNNNNSETITTMMKQTYINNNQPLPNHNTINQPVINGTSHVAPIKNGGEHIITGQNSVTTYFTSPLSSPLVQNTTHGQIYQFQPYLQPKEIIH